MTELREDRIVSLNQAAVRVFGLAALAAIVAAQCRTARDGTPEPDLSAIEAQGLVDPSPLDVPGGSSGEPKIGLIAGGSTVRLEPRPPLSATCPKCGIEPDELADQAAAALDLAQAAALGRLEARSAQLALLALSGGDECGHLGISAEFRRVESSIGSKTEERQR